MAPVKKNIGRLPMNFGDYDSTKAYGKKNRCFQYGCEVESKVENNTYPPFSWDGAETFVLDDAHWLLVSGNPEVWAAGNPKPATSEQYPYNGMGRVVLKKNIVNSVNALTQDMFYKGEVGSRVPNTDTIYVIQYDFTLGEDITIPANCVLEFDGGSLSNGKLIFSDMKTCSIEAGEYAVFKNITFSPNGSPGEPTTYLRGEGNPIWFGAIPDSNVDCSDAIQTCVNLYMTCKIPNGVYLISKPIIIWWKQSILGSAYLPHTLGVTCKIKASDIFSGDFLIKSLRRNDDVYGSTTWDHNLIQDLIIDCNNKAPALGLQLSNGSVIRNCSFINNHKYVDVLHMSYLLLFVDCSFGGQNNTDKIIEFSLGTNEPESMFYDVTFERCTVDHAHNATFLTINRMTTGIIRFNDCAFEDIPTIIKMKRVGNVYESPIIDIKNCNNFPVGEEFGDHYTVEIETIEAPEISDPYITFTGCKMGADKIIRYKTYDNTILTYSSPVGDNNFNFIDCYFFKRQLISSILFPTQPNFTKVDNSDVFPLVLSRHNSNKLSTYIRDTNEIRCLDAYGKTMIYDATYGNFPSAQDLRTIEDSNLICTRVNYNNEGSVTAIWSAGQWVNIRTGYKVEDGKGIGTTSQRPTLSTDEIGFKYIDTDLGKPIWWMVNASHPSGAWVDATGTPV